MKRFSLSLILVLCFAPWAGAQSADPGQLENLSTQQKQAEAEARQFLARQKEIENEITRLQNDLVRTSAEARAFEKAASAASDRLTELAREEQTLQATILHDRRALADFLAALQRIERQPPPSMLVDARNAVDGVRAAHLLSYLSTNLHDRSNLLKERLGNLQTIRAHMADNRAKIEHNSREVETRLVAIRSVIADKTALNDQLDKNRVQKVREAEKLAREAQDLRDLIQRFEKRASEIAPRVKPEIPDVIPRTHQPNPRLKPEPGRPAASVFTAPGSGRFSDTRGILPLPVYGRLSRKFGSRLAAGGTAQGVTLTTKTGAQLVAPFGGRVEFAGSFNDELVLILNVGDGYFIVFTGLGEIYADGGIKIAAGEPLGRMPKTGRQSAQLFMEFRKNGASIDPAPWIGPALASRRQ